jgi:hypothetical protein
MLHWLHFLPQAMTDMTGMTPVTVLILSSS